MYRFLPGQNRRPPLFFRSSGTALAPNIRYAGYKLGGLIVIVRVCPDKGLLDRTNYFKNEL